MKNVPQVPKDLFLLVTELLSATRVLKDLLDGIREGNPHQLIPLSGQLRGLLAERSKKSFALLLEVARQLDRPLTVYAEPSVNPSANLRPGELVFSGASFSLHKDMPDLEPLTIAQALDRVILAVHGKHITLRDSIKYYAEKAGGAHYSKARPSYFADLDQIQLGGNTIIEQSIYQTGLIAYELCRDLLRDICEFDLHVALVVKSQNLTSTHCILDAQFVAGPSRQLLTIDPLHRVRFAIVWKDRPLIVHGANLMSFDTPVHLQASVRWNDDLATSITLQLDDGPIASSISSGPLLVPASLADYRVDMGTSIDRELADLEAQVGRTMMTKSLSVLESAEAISLFRRDKFDNSENWPPIQEVAARAFPRNRS